MKIKRCYILFIWLLSILLSASSSTGQDLTVKEWREDLNYLIDRVVQLHPNPYHSVSKEEFDLEVSKVSSTLLRGNQEATYLSFVKLLAGIGDSHTSWMHWNYQGPQLPIVFKYFDDGLYIVGASKKHSQLLGARINKIAGLPLTVIDSMIAPLVAGENSLINKWIIPQYLGLQVVLHGLGLLEGGKVKIDYVLNGDSQSAYIKPDENPMKFDGLAAGQARWLSRPQSVFWYETIQEQQLLYLNYNQCTGYSAGVNGSQSMAEFASELTKFISDQPGIEKIFLDLRKNTGGESANNYPLIKALLTSPLAHGKGTFFVGMARESFSDTGGLLQALKDNSKAIFIGDSTSATPSFYSSPLILALPNSKLVFRVCTRETRSSHRLDYNNTFPPDYDLPYTSTDHIDGKDPLLAFIKGFEVETHWDEENLLQVLTSDVETLLATLEEKRYLANLSVYGFLQLESKCLQLLKKGLLSEAEVLAQFAVRSFRSPEALNLLGKLNAIRNDSTQAKLYYNASFELQPNNLEALNYLKRMR